MEEFVNGYLNSIITIIKKIEAKNISKLIIAFKEARLRGKNFFW
jgi:hypothetical protein